MTRTAPSSGTTIAAVPLLPGALAVIVAAPTATAVTLPASETTATAGLSLDHTTVRNTRCPAASRTWTASCTVAPSSRVSWGGVTVTVATGWPRTASHVPVEFPQIVVPLKWSGGSPEIVAV